MRRTIEMSHLSPPQTAAPVNASKAATMKDFGEMKSRTLAGNTSKAATMPKERPIIMSGDNPKLIREGRKTQTRRLMKPQPSGRVFERGGLWTEGALSPEHRSFTCPYGVAGDRLYVRENYAVAPQYDKVKPKDLPRCPVWYAADDVWLIWQPPEFTTRLPGRTRPSIHMMGWMSRIHLEILKVRVERLQDITEADAMAEEIETEAAVAAYREGHRGFGAVTGMNAHKMAYARLWDSLHGQGAWDKNPWCWVLDFRVEAPEKARGKTDMPTQQPQVQ